MSEHSSKPHEFEDEGHNCNWCHICDSHKDDPIHAQAEPKPVEIAEKRWREWWNLCKDGSTGNMNIRKNSLKALIEELSQAQQNVKSLRDTLELLAHEVFGSDLGSEPDVYADYDKLCELETIIRSTIDETEK